MCSQAYRVQLSFNRALNHEDDGAGVPATADSFDHEVEAENAVKALKAAIEGVYHQYHRVGRRHLTCEDLEKAVTLANVNLLEETDA